MDEIWLNGPLLLIGLRFEDISRVLPSRLTTLFFRLRSYKGSKLLYWVVGWSGGWVVGNCETITNSAEAEARVEAWAELGNIRSNNSEAY